MGVYAFCLTSNSPHRAPSALLERREFAEPLRLRRTLSSAVDPGLNQFACGFLTAGSGLAAIAGIPAPGHEIILGDVFLQGGEIPAAIEPHILQLPADVAGTEFLFCQAMDSGAKPQRGWPGMLLYDAASRSVVFFVVWHPEQLASKCPVSARHTGGR